VRAALVLSVGAAKRTRFERTVESCNIGPGVFSGILAEGMVAGALRAPAEKSSGKQKSEVKMQAVHARR